MASHTTLGIDDDVPSGETAVSLGPADHEPARRIDMINGTPIQILRGNHRLDDAIDDGFFELRVFDLRAVLGGNDAALNLHRFPIAVLDGHRGLAIVPEKIGFSAFANL